MYSTMHRLLPLVIILIIPFNVVYAQSGERDGAEVPEEVLVSDSIAVEAIKEARKSIEDYRSALERRSKSGIVRAVRSASRSHLLFEIYTNRENLDRGEEKLFSSTKKMMYQLSADLSEKAVVSDLSDKKRVVMPMYTVLRMIEANLDKFVIE